MDNQQKLDMLKVDLGLKTPAYDARLLQYIETATVEIERQGVSLDSSISDAFLIVSYASWMWRKRDTGESMPRMLRYALNNRIFSEKMGGDSYA